MNTELLFQAIQTAAVVIGVGFAVYETRKYRRKREREAALELLHAFQTPEFAKALVLVYRLRDGLSKREIEETLGEDIYVVYALMTTLESLGILVHRGEFNVDLVDDFFSGPIVVSWRKLKNYVANDRQDAGRETISEWFQWLAEAFMARESTRTPVPAHIQFRNHRLSG